MGRVKITVSTVFFFVLHVWALGVFFLAFSWKLVAAALFLYVLRMFAVTAGYHRYFSHRTFQMGRVSQFLLAFLAQTSGQKGVLWWGARHREHHRTSDRPEDVHSPITQGLWTSHVGWVLDGAHDDYDPKNIADFAKFPELVWLDRNHWICPWALGTLTFFAGRWLGWGGFATLTWGFVLSTVALWHATFCINSLAHLWGTRRFETPDRSRNNLFLALITLGEGWHNNHHHYQGSCRQGLRWWEVDFTFYTLKVLSWVGLVKAMRNFPPAMMGRQGMIQS